MIQKIAARLEEQIKENLFELELLDQKRAENVKSSKEYEEYIKSSEWQETRQRILKRDRFRCVMCGEPKNLHVHHITYENLGEEKDADLVTLCEECHIKLHDIETPHLPLVCVKRAEEIAAELANSDDVFYQEFGEMLLPIFEKTRKEMSVMWEAFKKSRERKRRNK